MRSCLPRSAVRPRSTRTEVGSIAAEGIARLAATARGAPSATAGSSAPRAAAAAVVLAAALLGGCSSMPSMPSLSSLIPPPPSFSWLPSWLGGPTPKVVPPAPAVTDTVAARVAWRASLGGKATEGFAPAIVDRTMFVALPDGTVVALDAESGAQRWRQSVGKPLSAGAGSDGNLVVVGTTKAEVIALDATGKQVWEARVSSEVASPPRVVGNVVVVWSGDGRIFGLSAQDGTRRWVYQRAQPPLVVRNAAGGIVRGSTIYAGTAGGRLLAIDAPTGSVRWEANVATPKGATELERIADVTSLPFADDRQVCAVAFQGRVACFDAQRGVLNWSRDLSSLGGLVCDAQLCYVTDDAGAVHAIDKATGASAWKQDKLAGRRPTGPQLVGAQLAVVDLEGRAYLMGRTDGAFVAAVPTDGAAAVSQPIAAGPAMAWLSASGTVFSVAAP